MQLPQNAPSTSPITWSECELKSVTFSGNGSSKIPDHVEAVSGGNKTERMDKYIWWIHEKWVQRMPKILKDVIKNTGLCTKYWMFLFKYICTLFCFK